MEMLVSAVSDFLAAVLSKLGFVGRTRRRAGIQDDLELLGRLRGAPEFGPDSAAHRFLVDHITLEVAKFAGVELKRTKRRDWVAVALALCIGLPLGYWTYKLNQDDFRWLSLIPGSVAGLMLVGALGTLLGVEETPDAVQPALPVPRENRGREAP